MPRTGLKKTKKFCKEKDFTQQRFAEKTFLSLDYICKTKYLEAKKIPIAMLKHIAKVLDIYSSNPFKISSNLLHSTVSIAFVSFNGLLMFNSTYLESPIL